MSRIQNAGIIPEISGIASQAHRKVNGWQIGGLASITDTLNGVQLSGLINFSEITNGFQLAGLINKSRKMTGVQLHDHNCGLKARPTCRLASLRKTDNLTY